MIFNSKLLQLQNIETNKMSKILIIEDEAAIRRVLKKIISEENDSYQVEEAEDGLVGLEMLKQEYGYQYEKQALADSLGFVKKQAIKDIEIEKRDANLAKQQIGLIAAAGGLVLLLLLALSIRRGKKRSDELLHNILPEEVAKELKANGKVGK